MPRSRVINTTNPYEKHRIILDAISDRNNRCMELSELAATLFQNVWLCRMDRFGTDGSTKWEYHTEVEKLFLNDSIHRELLRNPETLYELRGYFIREMDLGPDTTGSLSAYPEVTRMWVDFLQTRPPKEMLSGGYSKELDGEAYGVGAN